MGPVTVELEIADSLRKGRFEIEAILKEGPGGTGAGGLVVVGSTERYPLAGGTATVGRGRGLPDHRRRSQRQPPPRRDSRRRRRLRPRRPRLNERDPGQRGRRRQAAPRGRRRDSHRESEVSLRSVVRACPATLIQLLTICVLAVVYLFFLRVLRAVWVGVRPPRPRPRPVRSRDESGGKNQKAPAVLNVIEPPEQRGQSYALDDELTVGRAAGCRITVDDSYASQLHARVYIDEGVVSLEDLGSTTART